jgi:hypothetical protein
MLLVHRAIRAARETVKKLDYTSSNDGTISKYVTVSNGEGKDHLVYCFVTCLEILEKPRITSVKFSCQKFKPGTSQILSSSDNDHFTTTMTRVYIYFIIFYFFCLLLALYVLFFCSLSWVCPFYCHY